eukprot:1985873-Rhodomonas_salina.2
MCEALGALEDVVTIAVVPRLAAVLAGVIPVNGTGGVGPYYCLGVGHVGAVDASGELAPTRRGRIRAGGQARAAPDRRCGCWRGGWRTSVEPAAASSSAPAAATPASESASASSPASATSTVLPGALAYHFWIRSRAHIWIHIT